MVLDHREGMLNAIAALEGKRICLTIEPFTKKRSIPQNSYYHGVVLKILANHLGFLPKALHEVLKFKFLCDDHEAELPRVRSTSELTTVEFIEYIEQIAQLAANYGCYIPEPNEPLYDLIEANPIEKCELVDGAREIEGLQQKQIEATH